MFGLLNINKPGGITSRRVVDRVQRLVRPAKVGHAGTLDPLATGVLVLGIGPATRLVEYVQQMPKRYRATFLLGRSSTTEDVEGQVTFLANAAQPSHAELEQIARELTGAIEQRPPAYSALKVAGQRAYALARAGKAVDLAPRIIHIHRLSIERYEYPELELTVECSSGTYIRSLGRDLAERAGTAAAMSALVREAIGRFTLQRTVELEQLTRNAIEPLLLPPIMAIEAIMPQYTVNESQICRLKNGLSIACAATESPCAAVNERGELAAILQRREDGTWGPIKFLAG